MTYPLTYADYIAGLENGEFLGLRCGVCGRYTFPPQATCAACGASHLQKVEIDGSGKVRSFTVIRIAPEGFPSPYIVALVELNQGPWVLGNIVDMDPDRTDMNVIGKSVRMASQRVSSYPGAGEETRILTFQLIDEVE